MKAHGKNPRNEQVILMSERHKQALADLCLTLCFVFFFYVKTYTFVCWYVDLHKLPLRVQGCCVFAQHQMRVEAVWVGVLGACM